VDPCPSVESRRSNIMGRAISLQLHDHVSALLLRTEFVPVGGPVFELDLA